MQQSHVQIERANLLLEQGRIREAEAEIRQVLSFEPNNDGALSVLARCCFAGKRIAEGINVIRNAISINPLNSFYFYLLGFGYFQQGQLDDAITQLEKALSLYPYEAEYFGLLAYVQIRKLRFQTALEKADEGLALAPDNNTCLNARSTALNKMGRTDDAIETMQEALAQNPDSDHTHASVGWNHLEKGRHREAVTHFLEALRLNPDSSNAKSGLKEALKSRIPPYRWLLQYSFWVHNKGKKLHIALPIILYVVFRVLIGLTRNEDGNSNLTMILVSVYILFVVTSWTINSIANFFLLFHPLGRHALTQTERYSSVSSVAALVLGLAAMAVSQFSEMEQGTRYEALLFPAGMICISLALPLSLLEYPLRPKGYKWSQWYTLVLSVLGVISLVLFTVSPALALIPMAVYGIAFIVYNWTGLFR